MLFSSMIFIWIFLPIVFVGNFLCQKLGGNRLANALLLIASIFFYAWGEPVYVLLMIFSITLNWASGLLLSIVKTKNQKKVVLTCSIALNLLLLGYFKYAGMVVSTINAIFHTSIADPQISLPIGISFFTFQALSYVVDVYRGDCNVQKNYFKVALYVSFFPQLIAGPIVKYRDIEEAIDHRTISLDQTAKGIRRFVYGFGKKILIANTMALAADTVYGLDITEITGIMAWGASIFYTLEIYYDFSGYSDMAIGLGEMFGFEFKENFIYPYTSTSIKEFWRRWHVSLGSWFKEYVYFPLGGNRKGTVRTYVNLTIVFFLTGLWHGASWSFVLWGMLHGFLSVIERGAFGKFLERHKVFGWIYTMLAVNFAWVFFRVESITDACKVIKRMLLPWRYTTTSVLLVDVFTKKTVVVTILAILLMGFVQRYAPKQWENRWKFSYVEIVMGVGVMFLSLAALAGNTYNPFIYFRF